MVEGKIISIGNVAYVLGMNPKKLHRWYKEVLSGYKEAQESGQIGKDDILVREKGKPKRIRVPILKQENIGSYMAIDEKTIDGVCYTILSNRQTNKIAMMAATLKVKYLARIMSELDNKMNVISLSRDMASNYAWLGHEVFMNAYHVVDKFHVIKNAMESLQAIRIRHRQEELEKRRKAKQNYKQNQESEKWSARLDGREYQFKKFAYNENTYSNGDTTLQLLARSRGLLFIKPNKWSAHQKQRAKILFKKYPDIKEAYHLILQFRKWYSKPKEIVNIIRKKEKQLIQWIQKAKDVNIYEIDNFINLINTHMPYILNYFLKSETNAKAESLNSQIQRFLNVNYGARNTDFFLFRLNSYFS